MLEERASSTKEGASEWVAKHQDIHFDIGLNKQRADLTERLLERFRCKSHLIGDTSCLTDCVGRGQKEAGGEIDSG